MEAATRPVTDVVVFTGNREKKTDSAKRDLIRRHCPASGQQDSGRQHKQRRLGGRASKSPSRQDVLTQCGVLGSSLSHLNTTGRSQRLVKSAIIPSTAATGAEAQSVGGAGRLANKQWRSFLGCVRGCR